LALNFKLIISFFIFNLIIACGLKTKPIPNSSNKAPSLIEEHTIKIKKVKTKKKEEKKK
jgi:hypothetical protein